MELADKVSGPIVRITQKVTASSNATKVWRNQLRDASEEIPGLSRAMSLISNPIALASAGIVAFGTAGVVATKSAYNFEEGMAKINATAQLSKSQLGGLRDKLMEIGYDSGGNFNRIPESFEKILSQVGNVDQSLDILKASTKGATAGFTDLDVVSGALAQSMSIIGAQNAKAQDVLDTMFAAKRVGAGEFKDFATYLPTLIASGKNLGIEYKNVAGLFAYMTGKGQSASDSAMLLQNAFTALGKSDITSGMEKLGVNVFDKQGMMRDIGTIMTELGTKLNGLSSKEKLNVLEKIGLNDAQARNAFAILTSDANKLTEALNATNNATGETAMTLAKTQTPANNWKEALDKINFFITKIGYKLLPYFDAGLIKLGKAFDWLKKNASTIIEVFKNIWFFIDKVLFVVKWLTIALSPFIALMAVLGVVTLIATSPFTALAIVFVGLVTLFTVLYERSAKFRGMIQGVGAVLKGFGSAIKTYVLDSFKKLLSGITGIGSALVKFFKGDWQGAWETGKNAMSDLINVSPLGLVANGSKAFIEAGKQAGNNFRFGYATGALEVDANKGNGILSGLFGNKEDTTNTSVDANQLLGDKNKAPDLSGLLGKKGKTDNTSGSNSGGSGKSITMNLSFKQHFNSNSKTDVKEIAQMVVVEIVDKLRDGVTALD